VEVDRIASVISHDLRNPLDVAKANLHAARERGDAEYFESVEQAHDRMEGIIQDVLTLARGRRTLQTAPDVDIGSVASDAWATVDTDAASLTLGDDLPSTEVDPDRLQRLFENLFRNSVEHARPTHDDARETGSGPESDTDGPLQISVEGTTDGFVVADDGVGISPDERDRVFDPGYSTSQTGSGTGLGLTIVDEIADAHGWTVTLATGSEGGTQFEFHVSPEK
jgi:signal transduction histidine kinase